MRQPTDNEAALQWWRDALAGRRPPIHDGEPQCGWYRARLVRGGPWVPVRIWMESPTDPETGELIADEFVRAEIDGREVDPAEVWIRACAHPITEETFNYMRDAAAWDRRHDPAAPAANPHRAVDHLRTPIPF